MFRIRSYQTHFTKSHEEVKTFTVLPVELQCNVEKQEFF